LITNENARVAFSPVHPILVTVTVRECVFWDTGTWQPRHRLPLSLPGEVPGPLAFSRDGRMLALAADRRHITLLNPATATEWATLTAPAPENFENLSIGSDGSWVAAATMNWVIELWDLRTLRSELAVLGLDWNP
jgi:hypothetical protein